MFLQIRHSVRDETGRPPIQRAGFLGITSASPISCPPRIIISPVDRAFPFFSWRCRPKSGPAATAGGSVRRRTTRGLLIMEDVRMSQSFIFIGSGLWISTRKFLACDRTQRADRLSSCWLPSSTPKSTLILQHIEGISLWNHIRVNFDHLLRIYYTSITSLIHIHRYFLLSVLSYHDLNIVIHSNVCLK